jgi:hypothetical protein
MPPKIPGVERAVERADSSGEPKDIRYGMRVLRSNPRFAVVARQRHSWSEPLPTPSMPSNDSPSTAGRPMVALGSGARLVLASVFETCEFN